MFRIFFLSSAFRLLCVLCGEWVFAAEGYEIRAERMETEQEGQGVRRTYAGQVEASFDSVTVRAGQAVYLSQTDEVTFSQGAEATEPGRRVTADTLVYSLKARTAVASGGVSVAEGGRQLRASRAVLFRTNNRLEATGGVEAWYPARRTWLFADSMEIESGGDSGVGRGMARLTRTEAETLTVTAERIRFLRGGLRAEAEGGVVMMFGAFVARCSQALCDSDSVAMTGTPVLRRFRRGPEGDDSLEVSADNVGIFWVEGAARRLRAVGNARVLQKNLKVEWGPAALSRLEGDSVFVVVERGALLQAESRGAARSIYRDADSSEVELTAQTVAVAFKEGRANRVKGEGGGRASHTSADGSERSRLSGDGIEMEMEGGRVGGLLIEGHAVCEHLPDDRGGRKQGGKSRLTGDRIRLSLKDGSLKRAWVEAGAVGTYWMTEEERSGR